MFWCISAYLQTTRNFFSKEIFFTVWSGYKRVFMHLRILPDHQKPFFRKDIFHCLEWLKRVFIHLRILYDHQKLFFRKDIFYCLEWLKACFDAFAHTSRTPETFFHKRYFLRSGVVTNVFLCICAYFHTTRNFFFIKDIFDRLEWLKTCFDAFSHTSRPPESCP